MNALYVAGIGWVAFAVVAWKFVAPVFGAMTLVVGVH